MLTNARCRVSPLTAIRRFGRVRPGHRTVGVRPLRTFRLIQCMVELSPSRRRLGGLGEQVDSDSKGPFADNRYGIFACG